VDINDLTIVLANYNWNAGAAGGVLATPEPAGIILLSIAAGVLIFALRARPCSD